MKAKKHLSFTALRKFVSNKVASWPDSRRQQSAAYSIHDAVMSGFACMYFQEPSMLQFQQHLEQTHHQNNLRTLFGVEQIPSANALKEVVDEQDSKQFHPIFKGIAQRLQRGKQLDAYKLTDGLTVCSIDGTQFYSSQSVRCSHCLTKNKDNPNKPTIYQHCALQAALMHPAQKFVIPLMVEPIRNADGAKKQDCETNAAKRLIPPLRQFYPRMGLIITGDDLFSRQPTIERVLDNRFHFFFVAKSSSHAYMMKWLDTYPKLHELRERDAKGRTILYQWMNDVPLHGDKGAVRVNYFCKKTLATIPDGQEKIIRTESWVTDLEVTEERVALFARGAKSRWKIENECFNTLKNQGYHLEHNYGHGDKHLAFNFYCLTLLAFLFHQVFELCDAAYQANRAKGSKRSLWEKLRSYLDAMIFQSWEQLLGFVLDPDGYDIIGGHVRARSPPS